MRLIFLLSLALNVCLFGVTESFSTKPFVSSALSPPVSTLGICTALFAVNDSANSASPEAEESKRKEPGSKREYVQSRLKELATTVRSIPVVPTGVALLAGYRLGVKSTLSKTVTKTAAKTAKNAAASTARRFPVVSILLLAFGTKEIWFATPEWVKSNLRPRGKDGTDTPVDPNDMTSLVATIAKLQSLFALASEKLNNEQGIESDDEKDDTDTRIPFLVALRLMAQIKARHAGQRDESYTQEGTAVDLSSNSSALEGMDELFEYADWAYDELPNDQSLGDALAQKGYTLLRHVKPEKPGYVSHYVAINPEKKTALIGVKGTSGLEDLLTDCCGLAVSHDLPGPYVKGGNSTMMCHEGVLLSSQRLAADLEVLVEEFLLPVGYKILVTGHSLGAGVAALVGVLLRARFPQLWEEGYDDTALRVVAFASPPILDCDSALGCAPFVTTVVNNADIIPRASLSNLIVLMEFLKTVNTKLEETGEKPTNIFGVSQFMLNLSQSDDMAMSVDEVKIGMDQAFDSVELRNPDHLYVPGKVIQMYDLWSKQADDKGDPSMEDGVKFEQLSGSETMASSDNSTKAEGRTAEGAMVTDGTSKVLRSIELDSRFLSDHLAPGYRSSIRTLLDRAKKTHP
jgi:hypothetical protein